MQKRRLLLLIVLSVLCFAMTVSAAAPVEKTEQTAEPKWEFIAETKEGDGTFIDVASIVDGPDGSKEAWFLMEYKTPDCASEYAKAQKKCVRSIGEYNRFFSNKKISTLQSVSYFTDETTLEHAHPEDPIAITAGSVDETSWEYLFKPKK
ncbi:MAG: hypothetical protein AB9917_00130 [Negativicutes bacterium]